MKYLRKSVYLCRAPYCKHKNIVFQWVDGDNQVLETAVAWEQRCGLCNRSSFDLIYQKVLEPKPKQSVSPSVDRDDHRPKGIHPNVKEHQNA